MAEKSKSYELVKFPYEIISNALNVFLGFLDEKTKKDFSNLYQITYPDCEWTFDNEDQFSFEYRKENIIQAKLWYRRGEVEFSVSYDKGTSYYKSRTNISISLPNREDVEKVFTIFEASYLQYKENEKKIEVEEKAIPTYSVKKQLPSAFVDKELLVDLEEFLLNAVNQFNINKENYPLNFLISDSSGTLNLKSISSYSRNFFDDEIKEISIRYGKYASDFLITLKFTRERNDSNLDINITSENAREIAEAIKTGIMKRLQKSKTINAIYHPDSLVMGTIIFLSTITGAILLLELFINHIWSQWLTAITLILINYLIIPKLKPYITFKTKRNSSINKWNTFIIETILGCLLTWLIVSFVSSLH